MPFLVADSYPSTGIQPTNFRIYLDGATTPIDVLAQKNADGSVQLHYDLTSLAVGTHTVQASAAIEDVWGVSESAKAPTTPLALTRRDVTVKPTLPSNIGLAAS